MKKAIKPLLLAGGITGLYLFAIAPGRDRRYRMRPYEERPIAHRGLFDNRSDHPENSLPAFRQAAEAGFGIELDVQLTRDGRLAVFHDETLRRMCGDSRRLSDCSWEELQQLPLAYSDERIPSLDQVLAVIGGRVPLIVEVKYHGRWKEATRLLAERMDRYEGEWCMESFHPLAVRWMRKNRPQVLRGQLADNFLKNGQKAPWIQRFLLTNLLGNWAGRPDFIAYNHVYAAQTGTLRVIRRLFPTEWAAWTVKSRQEFDRVKDRFQIIIFDSFVPGGKNDDK